MASLLQKMFTKTAPSKVAPGIFRVQSAFVNAYLIGEPKGPFILVDTGLNFSADQLKRAIDDLYGVEARPAAIVLTHGHFDHAGSVEELSRFYDIPVYAHPMEVPYLTGMSEYPPQDPTVGGFGGQLSRLYSNKPVNVSERIHQLPKDGSVPGVSGWKWIHTPGHTPGHVSLFREEDAVLVAGDALITMNMRDMGDMMSLKPELNGPPEYFTPDWEESLRSIDKLAALRPTILATGHGEPLYYQGLELDLIDFADRFTSPNHGRYVGAPAHFNETGVVSLPPPVDDALPKIVAGAAAGLLAAITTVGIVRNRRKSGSKNNKSAANRTAAGNKRYNVLRTEKVVKRDNVVLSDQDRKEIYLQEKRALEREKERAREVERARIKEWEKARARREKERAKQKSEAEAKARSKQKAELEARARAKAKEKQKRKTQTTDWKDDLLSVFRKDKPAKKVKRNTTDRVLGVFTSRAPKQKEKTGVWGVFKKEKAK